MRLKDLALMVTTLLVGVAPALADNATPEAAGPRYTFSKVDDGFIRLDKQTGEVALCKQRTVGWTCQAAPEDRAVLENEIERLRSENAALKSDILAAGLPLPAGIMPEPAGIMPEPAGGAGGKLILQLPDDANVGRAMAYMGRVWDQFIEALAKAEKQMLNKS